MSKNKDGLGWRVLPLPYSRHFSIIVDYRDQPEPPLNATFEQIAAFLRDKPLDIRRQFVGTVVSGRRLVVDKKGAIRYFPSVTYSGITAAEPSMAISLLQDLAFRLTAYSSAGATETEATLVFDDRTLSIAPDSDQKKH